MSKEYDPYSSDYKGDGSDTPTYSPGSKNSIKDIMEKLFGNDALLDDELE